MIRGPGLPSGIPGDGVTRGLGFRRFFAGGGRGVFSRGGSDVVYADIIILGIIYRRLVIGGSRFRRAAGVVSGAELRRQDALGLFIHDDRAGGRQGLCRFRVGVPGFRLAEFGQNRLEGKLAVIGHAFDLIY